MFADKLMYTGFSILATRAAYPSACKDMLMPPQKHDIPGGRRAEVKEIESQYTSGLVTQGERYNKVVDIWGQAGDRWPRAMMEQLSKRPCWTTARARRSSRSPSTPST